MFNKIKIFFISFFIIKIKNKNKLKHDFWLKVKEEYESSVSVNPDVSPFLCYHSPTFSDNWEFFREEINKYAKLFLIENKYPEFKAGNYGFLFLEKKGIQCGSQLDFEIRLQFLLYMITKTK